MLRGPLLIVEDESQNTRVVLVLIDFGAGNLVFDPTAPKTYLAGGDPMTECLIVELQVQGRPVHLIVDTGLQGILLYEERLRKSVPGDAGPGPRRGWWRRRAGRDGAGSRRDSDPARAGAPLHRGERGLREQR
jgi:hypothetical protein